MAGFSLCCDTAEALPPVWEGQGLRICGAGAGGLRGKANGLGLFLVALVGDVGLGGRHDKGQVDQGADADAEDADDQRQRVMSARTQEGDEEAGGGPAHVHRDRRDDLQHDGADVAEDVADQRGQDEGDGVDGVHDDGQAEHQRLVDVEQAGGKGQLGDGHLGLVAAGHDEDGNDEAQGRARTAGVAESVVDGSPGDGEGGADGGAGLTVVGEVGHALLGEHDGADGAEGVGAVDAQDPQELLGQREDEHREDVVAQAAEGHLDDVVDDVLDAAVGDDAEDEAAYAGDHKDDDDRDDQVEGLGDGRGHAVRHLDAQLFVLAQGGDGLADEQADDQGHEQALRAHKGHGQRAALLIGRVDDEEHAHRAQRAEQGVALFGLGQLVGGQENDQQGHDVGGALQDGGQSGLVIGQVGDQGAQVQNLGDEAVGVQHRVVDQHDQRAGQGHGESQGKGVADSRHMALAVDLGRHRHQGSLHGGLQFIHHCHGTGSSFRFRVCRRLLLALGQLEGELHHLLAVHGAVVHHGDDVDGHPLGVADLLGGGQLVADLGAQQGDVAALGLLVHAGLAGGLDVGVDAHGLGGLTHFGHQQAGGHTGGTEQTNLHNTFSFIKQLRVDGLPGQLLVDLDELFGQVDDHHGGHQVVLTVAHQQAHGDGVVVDLPLHQLGLEVVGRVDGLAGGGDLGGGLVELALARQLDGLHGDGAGLAAVHHQVHHDGIGQIFIHGCVLLSVFAFGFLWTARGPSGPGC